MRAEDVRKSSRWGSAEVGHTRKSLDKCNISVVRPTRSVHDRFAAVYQCFDHTAYPSRQDGRSKRSTRKSRNTRTFGSFWVPGANTGAFS